MDSRSLARSGFGDGNGRKISVEESDFNEFHGCLPKSPMRDRFLNDLSSAPVSLSYDSPLPIRGRGSDDGDYDEVGISPDRLRNVSKSPVNERGGKSSMSVRTRNVSMSPLRGTDTVKRLPARTMHQDISSSPLREHFVSKFDERMEKEQGDEEEWRDRMNPKSSFNALLPEDSRSRPSNDISLDRRRQKFRDGGGDEFDQISVGKVSAYAEEHGMTSEGSIDDLIHGGDSIRETTDRDFRFKDDYAEQYRRPRVNAYQRFSGNYGNDVFLRNSKVPIESARMSASSSSLDGPSSYYLDSVHAYVRSRQSGDVRKGPANIHYMEHLEFKHKYQERMQRYPPKEVNELDDDLISSAGLYSGADDYSEDFRYRRGSEQQFLPDNNMPRYSYFNHGPGLDYELENTFIPFLYDDPYAGQMRRSRQQYYSQYPMPDYVPGYYDRDSFISYHTGVHVNHPIDMQSQDIPSFAFGMPPNSAVDPAGRMNLQRPDPRMYYLKMAHTGPREQTPHLPPRHIRRGQVASQNKRLCLPLLGGSPFVICHKCFELLKLPGNFMTRNKKVYQLQCGPCSYIMSFDLRDGSFKVPTFQKKPDPVKCTVVCSESVNESGPTHHHDSCADTSISIGSYDFEGNSIQSTESEARETSRRQILSLNLDEHARAISPSSRSSKERLSESISVRSSRPNSSEFPFEIRPPTGSPLREHLDHSNQCIDAEEENARNYAGKEKQVLEKDTSQDHSIAYTAATPETEVYSHDLSTRSSLSDSREDGSIDTPHYRKSFDSQSGHRSLGSGEVYVNGQQVPSHVVRKAEKLAGPILPGAYWYDPKAGFWGVMGHHCLGIIPPSIQEFSFPMPENCSRGDTTVYVNGRELQKMDLDLLASRGLPVIKGKRYIIDIFGKVLEEKSKEFIINLGNLAPTVVNTRKGYGMRVPKEFMP